jgi:hypothetical protein
MSDINPGTTFAPGQIINADVLNRLVGNATIKDGAIEASHLADDIISARLELNNTTIGDDDCFLVFDASDGELKKIRRGELKVTSNTQYTGGVVTGNTGSETTIDAVTGNITLQSGDVEIASGSLRTASIAEGVVGEGIQLLSDLIIPASGRIVSTPIDDGNGNISHDIVLDENGLQIFGTTIDANGLNGGVFDIPTIKTNIIDSNNSSIDITKTITTPAVYAGSEGRVLMEVSKYTLKVQFLQQFPGHTEVDPLIIILSMECPVSFHIQILTPSEVSSFSLMLLKMLPWILSINSMVPFIFLK